MDVRKLAKAELHRHLELCVRPSTIRELAPEVGIQLPNEEAFRSRFLITEPMRDLGTVLNKFLDTQKLWSSTEIIERLTFEACEDAFRIDNIRILELRYAPTFILQGHEQLNFNSIHEAIVKGIRRAESKFPMAVGLLCIVQRISTLKEAQAVMDFAIEHKESFVGVDLADNEVGFDSKPFSPLFQKAKKAGLGVTIHSGEANVPNAPRYVQEAVDHLGASRIGHGVQIYRDAKVVDYVREKNILLELCPTSNWLTQAVPNKQEHPFEKLFDMGVHVTINTDDPGIFNIDLNHEYEFLSRDLKLSEAKITQCNQWAAEHSFIPKTKRDKVWSNPLKS